jgi:hypothetical protein
VGTNGGTSNLFKWPGHLLFHGTCVSGHLESFTSIPALRFVFLHSPILSLFATHELNTRCVSESGHIKPVTSDCLLRTYYALTLCSRVILLSLYGTGVILQHHSTEEGSEAG